MKDTNPMREARVEKITLNIGCGTKLPIDTAKTLLQRIVPGRTVVVTKSRKRSTFNVPKDKPLGVRVTLREGTAPLLKRLLEARDFKVPESSFDSTGNFAFGVKEYIDVPGIEYDPKMPMIGFDVAVTLVRPGYRVKQKKIARPIGKRHQMSKADAIAFAEQKLGIKVVKKE